MNGWTPFIIFCLKVHSVILGLPNQYYWEEQELLCYLLRWLAREKSHQNVWLQSLDPRWVRVPCKILPLIQIVFLFLVRIWWMNDSKSCTLDSWWVRWRWWAIPMDVGGWRWDVPTALLWFALEWSLVLLPQTDTTTRSWNSVCGCWDIEADLQLHSRRDSVLLYRDPKRDVGICPWEHCARWAGWLALVKISFAIVIWLAFQHITPKN